MFIARVRAIAHCVVFTALAVIAFAAFSRTVKARVPDRPELQIEVQIASGLLSGGNINIARVAAEVGYGSEAAFSRAFKKMVGIPPSAWRHRLDDNGSRRNVGPLSTDARRQRS